MTARANRAANRDAVRFFEEFNDKGITTEVFNSAAGGNILSFVSSATDQITAAVLNDYKLSFRSTYEYGRGSRSVRDHFSKPTAE